MNELLALTPAQIEHVISVLETRLILLRNLLARINAENELGGKVDQATIDELVLIAKGAP